MPKHSSRPNPKYTFTFALVEYHAYDPVRVSCRYYRHVEGYGTIFRECSTWKEIFDELKDFHPNETFEIPDVMPIIKYGKDGRLIKDDE